VENIAPSIAFLPVSVHTATMTLKNAATLALIGTLLLTVLLGIDFINSLLALTRGLIPAMAILRSLIYVFASLAVTVFFYVFSRAQ
jgi:hypothetical protein